MSTEQDEDDPLHRFILDLDRTASESEAGNLLLRLARELGDEAVRPAPPHMIGCEPNLLKLEGGLVGSESGPTYRINRLLYIENPASISLGAVAQLESASRLLEKHFAHTRDGLTGLYTHRTFQDKLHEEIEYAARQDKPLVLVMVDADNFKTYNDTLGHPAGDALLKEIAALLQDKTRATDIICRYGGDEFAMLLVDTRKEDAARMCERIREAFQLRFGGNQVQVTSSIGLACFPIDADSKKDLAQAADDALYVSKRNGRNKVSVSKDLETRRREGPMVQEIIKRPAEEAAEMAAAAKAAAERMAAAEARRKAGLPPEDEPPWGHPSPRHARRRQRTSPVAAIAGSTNPYPS